MKKLAMIFSLLLTLCMLGSVSAYATGTTDARITLIASSSNIQVGDKVKVTVGVTGDSANQALYGTPKITAQWDPAYFEFVSAEVDSTTFKLSNPTRVSTNYVDSKSYVVFSQKILNTEIRPSGTNTFGSFTLRAIAATNSTNIFLNTTGTMVSVNAGTLVTQRVGLPENTVAAIKIIDIPVHSVAMTSYSAQLKVGETKQLCASVLPKNASNKTLSWSSNNTTVASVDSNGVVTAKATGTAIITAKSNNGKKASCIVTVTKQNVINYDDFKYSFRNVDTSFGYDKYLFGYKIPYERYMQLGFEKSKAKTMVSEWGAVVLV